MVMYFGLNEKIGNISYYDSTGNSEMSFQKPFSEKTAERIDAEVSIIVEGAYARAKDILTKHKEQLTTLAQYLLEKEVIFKENLEEIFGKRLYDTAEERAEKHKKKVKPIQNGEQIPIEKSDTNSNGSEVKKENELKENDSTLPDTDKQSTLF